MKGQLHELAVRKKRNEMSFTKLSVYLIGEGGEACDVLVLRNGIRGGVKRIRRCEMVSCGRKFFS